ncbi:MAG: 16S rRNA (cytosine(967)-C(5))-methyltransferase RsmB [Salinibacter sp.]
MESPIDTVSPPRVLALQHLERVRKDDAYVGELTADDAEARTRRQARELVAGVTRQRRWLDFVLGEAYHDDYESMEHRLRQILRLGLYELLFQSTPTHAAVDEYVELAKQELRPGAGNLVNGVLRTIDRDREHIPVPDTGDDAEDLAIRYSHPTWMVDRWLDRFGIDETTELLRANNRRPMYGVRINLLRTSRDAVADWLDEHDVVHIDSPYLDNHLRLKRLQALVEGGLLDDGHVAVQDESAGLAMEVLDPQPGDMLIDGCAAPGGKTMHAATRMDGEGTIQAFDVDGQRLETVADAADTHGVPDLVYTEAADLRQVADQPDPPEADRVLLDVPCTGLGVLAKRADLRWRRTPDDLEEMIALQDQLLDAAATLVKPGGLLVYSTCSIEPEENEQRVDAFLARHDQFAMESVAGHVPDEMVSDAGHLMTLPQRHRMDGAFAARLRRVTS